MTILQMTNAYGPRTGGIRTHLESIRPVYARMGLTAALLVPGERDEWRSDAYGPVVSLAAPVIPLSPDYRNLWARGPVLRAVRELRPDVIELIDKWTLPAVAGELARLGLPTLGFSCERLGDVLAPYLGRGACVRHGIRRYNGWFCRQFRTVVCHSHYAAEELCRAGAENVVRIPLGVHLEVFRPDARDEALRAELLGDGEHLLLYVGRLVREKGVRLLPAMMRELAPEGCRLVVAGAGPAGEEALLRAAPGMTLLGFTRDRARLAGLYASCDAFVFPSGIETFALSVLEALASGCRVAAVRGGAVPEVLPPGAGVLAEPRPEALAGAVRSALELGSETAAAAGRRAAEQYPWKRTAAAVVAQHRKGLGRE